MNNNHLEKKLPTLEQSANSLTPENAAPIEQPEFEQPAEATTETQPAAPAAEQGQPLRRPRPKPVSGPIISPVRDEVTIRIEKIMEDGVGDAFQRLSPIARQEFKLKGEQTAVKIRELLKSTHVKVKKIFQLILEWLKMLPGVNRFFLEQEAKIKTDKIVTLHNKINPPAR